jgi:hypothetical protein
LAFQRPLKIFFRNSLKKFFTYFYGKFIRKNSLTHQQKIVRTVCRGGDGSQVGRRYRALKLQDAQQGTALASFLWLKAMAGKIRDKVAVGNFVPRWEALATSLPAGLVSGLAAGLLCIRSLSCKLTTFH